MMKLRFASLALALAIPVLGCGGDDGGGGGNEQGEVDPAGTHTTYVFDQIQLPTSVTEAQNLGLDLDNDPQGRPDNALGNILSALANAGGGEVDIQGQIDDAVAFGDIVVLASVQSTSLTTATGVGLWVFLGSNPSPAPCVDENDMVCGRHLDGTASFEIDPASPTDAVVVGQLVGGKFNGGPGSITLELSLLEGTAPVTLNLVGARAEINASASGLTNGKLGGAITEEDLENTVLPAIADLVQMTVAEDCMGTAPACCADDESTGATLLGLFDEDPVDCEISLTEIVNSSLISSLLAPDVDLFDCPSETSPIGDCEFNPGRDQVKDSLSLGIGVTATTATYDLPAGF